MSHPPYAPAPPRPVAAARRAGGKERLPWTWLERFLVIQGLVPVLLFVPGVSSVRVVIRILVFLVPLGTGLVVVQSCRARPGDTFPAATWLKLAFGWMCCCIALSPSIPAAVVQVLFYTSVFSPALWAPRALASPRQLTRLMALIFAFNALSAFVGLGQVFRPGTFNPPVIAGVTGNEEAENLMTITDATGRKFVRPCGLSDSPGAAAGAGGIAFLTGLAMALRPIGALRRLICLGAAFGGMAVIYYSQVRMVFLMTLICVAAMAGIFVLQRNLRQAALLGGFGAALVVGSLAWVMATSGEAIVRRFVGLTESSLTDTFNKSGRAAFVEVTFTHLIWDYPIGMGLGRYGTVSNVFGSGGAGVWVEIMVQAWVVDGGIPLLLLYVGGIIAAMLSLLRVALRSPDPTIRFWAAVALASNISTVATCLSYVTFVTMIGLQFWFLSALICVADHRARVELARRRRASAPPAYPPPYPAPPYPAPPAPGPVAPA